MRAPFDYRRKRPAAAPPMRRAVMIGSAFDTSHIISKIMPMDSVVEAMDSVHLSLEDVIKVLLSF